MSALRDQLKKLKDRINEEEKKGFVQVKILHGKPSQGRFGGRPHRIREDRADKLIADKKAELYQPEKKEIKK